MLDWPCEKQSKHVNIHLPIKYQHDCYNVEWLALLQINNLIKSLEGNSKIVLIKTLQTSVWRAKPCFAGLYGPTGSRWNSNINSNQATSKPISSFVSKICTNQLANGFPSKHVTDNPQFVLLNWFAVSTYNIFTDLHYWGFSHLIDHLSIWFDENLYDAMNLCFSSYHPI